MAPKDAKKSSDAKNNGSKSSKKGKKDTTITTKDKEEKTTPSSSSNDKKDKLKSVTAIQARHILCAKHARKEQALEQLRAGRSFDDVAREYSEDKARQGGALGGTGGAGASDKWQQRGKLLPEFELIAFALAESKVGEPIWGECKTTEGYHIVMVEARK